MSGVSKRKCHKAAINVILDHEDFKQVKAKVIGVVDGGDSGEL